MREFCGCAKKPEEPARRRWSPFHGSRHSQSCAARRRRPRCSLVLPPLRMAAGKTISILLPDPNRNVRSKPRCERCEKVRSVRRPRVESHGGSSRSPTHTRTFLVLRLLRRRFLQSALGSVSPTLAPVNAADSPARRIGMARRLDRSARWSRRRFATVLVALSFHRRFPC